MKKEMLNTVGRSDIAYGAITKKSSNISRAFDEIRMNKSLYIMIIPVLAFYLLFAYKPMYGAIIAFKDFFPGKGIWGSEWVGFKHFIDFFQGLYFKRTLINTIVISFASIIFGFPAPIILALMINELRSKYFTKLVQTVTYMPHFISLVVICGLIKDFTNYNGIITTLLGYIGYPETSLLENSTMFVPIYVISGIWQEVGFGSIIYLAALMGVDQQLYEAAKIDGASRWKQTLNVTIPGIMPTVVIMLILRLGGVMNIGFEKIILLYNPLIYDVSDVISSYVYRKGILEFSYSFSSAVGLFNSAINFVFLIGSNWLSKKFNDSSLW